MAFYENVFIARQDLSTTQVDGLADTFTNIVKEKGGNVAKREYWGLRNLAYRIRKNRKGHYVLFNIDAPPAALQEMERNMRLNEDVLRYISIKVETLEEGPSAMMQKREERGDRDRDRDRGPRRRDDFGGDRPPRESREPREARPPRTQGDEA